MENRPAAARPTGLTITAWLWIVMGVLMLFSGLMGAIAYFTIGHMGPLPEAPPDAPAVFGVMTSLFEYFGLLVLAQAAVAIVAVSAGIALLQLRAWARMAIEVLSWLAFAYFVGFGVLWLVMWLAMTGDMPHGGEHMGAGMIQVLGAAMGVVVTALFAVPLAIMIRYLRGAEARNAVSR